MRVEWPWSGGRYRHRARHRARAGRHGRAGMHSPHLAARTSLPDRPRRRRALHPRSPRPPLRPRRPARHRRRRRTRRAGRGPSRPRPRTPPGVTHTAVARRPASRQTATQRQRAGSFSFPPACHPLLNASDRESYGSRARAHRPEAGQRCAARRERPTTRQHRSTRQPGLRQRSRSHRLPRTTRLLRQTSALEGGVVRVDCWAARERDTKL